MSNCLRIMVRAMTYKFRELQKAKKLQVEGPENKLAVLGNCSTQFFSDAIEGFGKLSGINMSVYDADYNQIDEQLLDENSEVYSFKPNEILIWLCSEKLYEDFLSLGMEDRVIFAENTIKKIEQYWNLIEKNCESRIIQLNFAEINDAVMGQYSCKVESTFIYQIRKLNYLLQESALRNNRVYIVDLLSMQIQLGAENVFNAPIYYSAKMPIAQSALSNLASAVIDIIKAMSGKIKKCVVLDLDNTLWGGVIGDDGINGIEIGELGRGHVFTNLQKWLKQLKEYGIILAVCSKNEEVLAKEPFTSHEDMVLRLDDISIFVANWDDKASNIRAIQESLNIGMDSMIFLDDNPFERNLVRESLAGLEVPELPDDPSNWLEFLEKQNYFETASYTGPSMDRTKLYQEEFKRRKLEQSFSSIDDYLESLKMLGYYHSFEPAKYSRIAQLTQRSNQFNLRTIRYTEDEIQHLAESDAHITLYFTLKDKFGDYGLVSVVILKKLSVDELFIDAWLMSCRVLKRGMEEFVMNSIIMTAKSEGFDSISAEYIPTAKNMMVKDIYSKMGYEQISDNKYTISVDKYSEKKTYISKEEVENES